MADLRGLLGLLVVIGIAVAVSRHRRAIPWRTVAAALLLQVGFAALVLRWDPGERALEAVADQVTELISYTQEGTAFVFGPLMTVGSPEDTIFALQVLPVIVYLGALIGLLYYLRIIQYATHYIGGGIAWLLRVSKIESMYASTVIFLGQSEAPLMIAPYLPRLTRAQLFTVMSAGFASVAGSTLVGYSLLGAPLEYLLAATVMNAPASLLIAKIMWPDRRGPEAEADRTPSEAVPARQHAASDRQPTAESLHRPPNDPHNPDHPDDPDHPDGPDPDRSPDDEVDVRDVRDDASANIIDAVARGALAGGRIAVTVGALLIAFIALIALANGILGGIGGWFGSDDLTFQKLLGWLLAPLAWLLGVPWSEATQAGTYIGEKTVLNEFVAYADFGPDIASLSPTTVVIVTFALAGFANFASIGIQIGTIGSLQPERRSEVAQLGLRALLAGSLANLSNAAIAGLIA